jgi:membrane protease YdiL (CAAX protease family)
MRLRLTPILKDGFNLQARPLALMAVFFVFWLLRMAAYGEIDGRFAGAADRQLVSAAWRIALWIGLPLVWLKFCERRDLDDALHPCQPLSPRWWPMATLGVIALIFVGERLTRGVWTGVPEHVATMVLLRGSLAMVLVAIAEEFLCRGVILSGLLVRGWGYRGASLAVSMFFTLTHWPGWLYGGTIGWKTLAELSVRIFLFGLLMAYLVRLEGGLKSAMLVHLINNLVAGDAFKS